MGSNYSSVCFDRQDFGSLFTTLKTRGYSLIGPTLRNNVILYDALSNVEDLPIGWREEQDAGMYRLRRRGDSALFGYNVGPHSWKQFLFPPGMKLWDAQRTDDGFEIGGIQDEAPRCALIGVRACEIQAIRMLDKIFAHNNPQYRKRRKNAFIVAVNCGQAAGTCFCASMNAGPVVTEGYDIALTEIIGHGAHYFVAVAGSDEGAAVLAEVPHRPASENDMRQAAARLEDAEREMGRRLDTQDIKDMLYRNYENKRWEEVAERCLSCANCTMVCPTCFCSKVEDTTDLTGNHAERWQLWDSCFTMDFSTIHGGTVRSSVKSRYRQWMTHKLGTWIDQFGSSGCVGCGRCIAWCPVGIDITAEASALRESEKEQNNG